MGNAGCVGRCSARRLRLRGQRRLSASRQPTPVCFGSMILSGHRLGYAASRPRRVVWPVFDFKWPIRCSRACAGNFRRAVTFQKWLVEANERLLRAEFRFSPDCGDLRWRRVQSASDMRTGKCLFLSEIDVANVSLWCGGSIGPPTHDPRGVRWQAGLLFSRLQLRS